MFAISPTDNDWFEFLKGVELNSFINFWTPTPWNINSDNRISRWYFLLKSPIREIAGFGEFIEYKNLTANEAWIEFGQRNGCIDKDELLKRVQSYIDKNSKEFGKTLIQPEDYKIGCIVLKNSQFWEPENYKKPKDYGIEFPTQVVKFKYFPVEDPFFSAEQQSPSDFKLLDSLRESNKREINQRFGQSTFKGMLLKAYNNKCCISGESCPELLEAAHIQKYINKDSNHIQNGILLRVDLHRLFDSGLLWLTEDYRVQLSSEVLSLEYRIFNNKEVRLPILPSQHPSKLALKERARNCRL